MRSDELMSHRHRADVDPLPAAEAASSSGTDKTLEDDSGTTISNTHDLSLILLEGEPEMIFNQSLANKLDKTLLLFYYCLWPSGFKEHGDRFIDEIPENIDHVLPTVMSNPEQDVPHLKYMRSYAIQGIMESSKK